MRRILENGNRYGKEAVMNTWGNYRRSPILLFSAAVLMLAASPALYAQETERGPGPMDAVQPFTAEGPGSIDVVQPSGAEGPSSYGPKVGGDVTIQIDPETGSLIVVADEETNERIKTVLKSLDRPVPQVLIKVVFVEVTHSNDLDLGVEGSIKYNGADDDDVMKSVFGLASETRGAFFQVIEDDLSVTLRAIREVGKLEVLSKPSILTRNNQEAIITVGEEVPFIRNTRITSDGQEINTVEYEDIGIILTVTPFINAQGLVEMDIYTEISTITGKTVPISATNNAAVFAKRSAETMVVAPDGKTVVIGGLMEDNVNETHTRVPILGDIPILGFPFRRTEKNKSKTELLIFLTPYVVRTEAELKDMALGEKNRTELVPEVFSEKDIGKYIDNLEE